MAAVAKFDDLTDGAPIKVEVEGEAVALVRLGDTVHAVEDRCSHADFSLSEGEVFTDECSIECWKHGASFSLTTGEPDSLPATQPIAVHEATVVDGEVHVTLAERS